MFINRRSVLFAATATAVQAQNQKKFRIGIVGTGNRSWAHLQGLGDLPDLESAAMANLEQAGSIAGGWRESKTPDFYWCHLFWKGVWEEALFGADILALRELALLNECRDRLIEGVGLPPETVRKISGKTAARSPYGGIN